MQNFVNVQVFTGKQFHTIRKTDCFNAMYGVFFILSLISASCQKTIHQDTTANGSPKPGADLSVTTPEYEVSPSTTDAAINTFNEKHFASVQQGGVLKNTLFVFLPGSYRIPSESYGILRKSASMGYHTIGLMYPNNIPVNPLCENTDDITCHSRARLEVVDGLDRHPSINVNPANSIINRLTKLLLYLQKTHPTQNWGQYLVAGKPDWSKIIISGHSQGGALAGIIGKYYPVKKVVIFSMIDFLNSTKWPDWEDNKSRRERYFAISNVKDELVPYEKVKTGWLHLGMSVYGDKVNADLSAPPYGNTHTLITTAVPNTTLLDKYHNSTAVDAYIPKDASGKFIYDKAWEYLIGR